MVGASAGLAPYRLLAREEANGKKSGRSKSGEGSLSLTLSVGATDRAKKSTEGAPCREIYRIERAWAVDGCACRAQATASATESTVRGGTPRSDDTVAWE